MDISRTEAWVLLWVRNALEPAIASLVGQCLRVSSNGDSVPVAIGRDLDQGHNRLWYCRFCCSMFLTVSASHTMQVPAFKLVGLMEASFFGMAGRKWCSICLTKVILKCFSNIN